MSNMRDGPVLKAVAEVIRDHVGKAFAFLQVRIDEIEQRFKELPQPQQGPPGVLGAAGNDGKDGAPGEQGIAGLAGADGRPGKDGDRGADGLAGEPGKDGRDGIDGAKGNDGAAGKDGADGLNGKDGRDGIDAPLVDIEALTVSVTEKVLKQIPPPSHGKDGKDGASVTVDDVRLLIASEVTKAVGALPKPPAGRDGRDGRQGEPGLDAADLEIVQGIDESASYQRGVFARHRNGLWHAYRTTDPVENKDYEAAGWQCLAPGIWDEVSSLAPDQRTVVRSLELSDGKLITSSFTVPTMIHRGTWKDGEYQQGDSVTLGGSTWVANNTNNDRPGTSKAWTLCVKRGSDGKDLRPPEDELNGSHKRGAVYLSAPKL